MPTTNLEAPLISAAKRLRLPLALMITIGLLAGCSKWNEPVVVTQPVPIVVPPDRPTPLVSPLTEQTADALVSSWFLKVNQDTAADYLQLCEGYADVEGNWHEPMPMYCRWSVAGMTNQGHLNFRSYLISLLGKIESYEAALNHYDRLLEELKKASAPALEK